MRAETQDLDVLVPRALRRARAVCTLAEVTKARISAEFGYPEERIFVTPPGVGSDWFDPTPLTVEQRTEHGIPRAVFRVRRDPGAAQGPGHPARGLPAAPVVDRR